MRTYRWGLVAATLLGVLAMHGLGNHGVHGAETGQVVMSHGSTDMDHTTTSTTGDIASPGLAQTSGLGLEVLCLAILAGLVLALRPLRRVRSATDWSDRLRHGYSMVRPRARGPDSPTLAELSILRC